MKKTKGKYVSPFRGKLARHAKARLKKGTTYGYLNLPSGINMFKEEPDTKVRMDIVPYYVTDPKHLDRNDEVGDAQVGELWYTKPYYLHRNIGANNTAIVCPSTFGLPCPICEFLARSKKQKKKLNDEEYRTLKPALRMLYNIIPYGVKKTEEKPHLWDVSYHNFQKLLQKELKEDEDQEIFPDLEEGKTLIVRFDEEDFAGNKFAKASRIDFKDRDYSLSEELITSGEVADLDDVLILLSYDKIEKVFYEIPDDVEEDEDAEKPVKRRKTYVVETGKKMKDEDEDEDDDDEDEDEEDEPVTKRPSKKQPMNKHRKPKKVEPEEEDDDDEEDDDEEPEVQSVRTKKSHSLRDDPEFQKVAKKKGNVDEDTEDVDDEDIEDDDEVAEDVDDDDEDEKEEVKPRSKKDSKKSKPSGKEKCPFGHRFGKDAEAFDDCDECEIWKACLKAGQVK